MQQRFRFVLAALARLVRPPAPGADDSRAADLSCEIFRPRMRPVSSPSVLLLPLNEGSCGSRSTALGLASGVLSTAGWSFDSSQMISIADRGSRNESPRCRDAQMASSRPGPACWVTAALHCQQGLHAPLLRPAAKLQPTVRPPLPAIGGVYVSSMCPPPRSPTYPESAATPSVRGLGCVAMFFRSRDTLSSQCGLFSTHFVW